MVDIPTHAAALEPAVSPLLMAREHLVLVRHLARLQHQMTLLVRSHETQLRHWQRQLMRQSVRLMLERTRADWGQVPRGRQALDPTPAALVSTAPLSDSGLSQTLATAQTDALVCRTGCQMDGDHWRNGELCKRDGRACVLGVSAADATES